MTQGFVRLNANGTFSASHTLRFTSGTSSTNLTQDINGTYTRSGEAITLTFDDPETGETTSIDAVWEGNQLTVDDGVDILVYDR